MSKEEKNPLSKEELLEFLENLPKLRLSKSGKKTFRECGDIKWPSKHWNDVKHIRLDAKHKETVLDSFEEGKKEQQESKNHGTGESKGNRSSKRSEGKVVKGIHFHALLYRYLMGKRQSKEAKKGQDDAEGELLQAKAVVKEIETRFECEIVASEAKIQGFATSTNEKKQHYWKGRMDAVALGKTDGRVLVIEWATCDDVTEFWKVSKYCSQKLHQCLIYRELVDAHLKEYFGENLKMDSGIMIVAIDRENMNVLKPRLCVNFESLKKEEFFTSIVEFTWQGRIEKLDRVKQDLQQIQDRLANSERSRQSAERQVKDKGMKIKELEDQIEKLEKRHDPWLHHHANQSGGPSMSPEIARSARLLQLSAEREMEPCLCESPKKCAHSRGRGLCSCKADGLTCTNKCSCCRWECKNRF